MIGAKILNLYVKICYYMSFLQPKNHAHYFHAHLGVPDKSRTLKELLFSRRIVFSLYFDVTIIISLFVHVKTYKKPCKIRCKIA